ncbi:SMP-30/gluconolactonase/LRE family protein [Nocardia sp. CA-107356]|uniref:SMP-30/gluconolactonase/LRE family protein n=1 Tax=Nocardia sp. CA-107356 TaxID=3239972 RepID=UPI003D8AFE8F
MDGVVEMPHLAVPQHTEYALLERSSGEGGGRVVAQVPDIRLLQVDPDSAVSVAAGRLRLLNGITVTPDQRRLIVAEAFGACLSVYDLDNATLSNRRTLCAPGAPNGISEVDGQGCVWVASPLTNPALRITLRANASNKSSVIVTSTPVPSADRTAAPSISAPRPPTTPTKPSVPGKADSRPWPSRPSAAFLKGDR